MSDTETKKVMDALAAELKKPAKQRNQQRITELNKKLDKLLGTELKDEDWS